MKNKELHELNFNNLLQYPDEFTPAFRYTNPIKCRGFCVSCENEGVLDECKGKLTLMSHGCDSEDFMKAMGNPPPIENKIEVPVLFLFQDPGGDHSNLGAAMKYKNISKKPPTNHYYFTCGLKQWPTDLTAFNGNFYGSYFAYLMAKHGLTNTYITNIVKCKRVNVLRPDLVEKCCVARYLKREIEIFNPLVTFCFGDKDVYRPFKRNFCNQDAVCLYHPSFIQNYAQTKGLTKQGAIAENDKRIFSALNKMRGLE